MAGTKKTTAAKKTASKTTPKKAETKQEENQTSTKNANKSTSKASTASTSKNTTKAEATAKSTTSKAKTESAQKEQPAQKLSTPVAEKKDGKKTNSAAKATSQPKQRSGNGLAFLALICSFGALALSAYNLYETKLSPQASNARDLASDLGSLNATINTLQNDVQTLTQQQSEFMKSDSVEAIIADAVANSAKQISEINAQVIASNEQPSVVTSDSPVTMLNNESESNVMDSDSDHSAASSESITSNDAKRDETFDELWSWQRMKSDFFSMFNFISIRKTDETQN